MTANQTTNRTTEICMGKPWGKAPAKPCVLPFTYDGTVHTACTLVYDTKAWCATRVDSKGVLESSSSYWAYCSSNCPVESLL